MSEKKRNSFTEQEKYAYADAIKRTSMSASDMQIVSETEDGKSFNIDEIVNYINSYIAATKKKPVVVRSIWKSMGIYPKHKRKL